MLMLSLIDSLLLLSPRGYQIKYLMKGKRCCAKILYILCRAFMSNINFIIPIYTLRNRLRDTETCMRSFICSTDIY